MAGEERHPDGVGLAPDVPAGYRRTVVGVIPADWVVTRLCDCGEIVMGQSPPGISYNRSGAGSALINGPTEFTETHPVKVQWTTEPKRFCKPGDLLICVRGSSTGRTNYADDIYAIGRGVAAVRAKAANDTQYLSYQVILGVSNLLAAATGSTFPSVDGASLRKILILSPLPPEQRAIAAVLSDVDELIGSLEALIAKKRAIKQAAMQQLLTGRTRLPGFGGEWEMVELGAVLRIRDRKISPVEVGGDTPCVELEHIGQGDGRLASHGTAAKSSSIKYQFEPRDILFGRLRPYLRKWWYADRGGVCSTEIWPLVVDRKRAASGFVYTLVQNRPIP